ncbi:glycine betaine ABC transporter substrate-binding protein [Clostridium sp. DJ247]|uniref:glycine betaine ABC transporter substrate-binding protein n=1 Tax=Clostridium sp. DJ247 TaxID=2726188 RepID=UPI001628A74D|nr:glycine betaine ABC transporter substrate-binding protein [Clostridium sp. DJ247]MBC2582638.1 glycine/betaine ABC transporter substrate-binding protein [Clostridium sp. DJ247]
MNKTRNMFIGVVVIILAIVIAFIFTSKKGSNSAKSNEVSTKKITVGSKNFTENLVIAEMYSLALENAGYTVDRKLNLGGTLVAHEALKKGDIDMYPEYTGTGLLDVLKAPKKSDPKEVYDYVSAEYKKNWDLVWLKSTNANDSQGLAVSKKTAEKYDLYTISKFAEVAPNIRFASVPEFNERQDGLKGLKEAYGGMNFKDNKLYDYGIKYKVLLEDKADATVAFTTDGQLTDKNFVLLKDDKHFWPPYYLCPVIRGSVLSKYPEVQDIINKVSEKLTDEVVQQLNADVDINKKEYKDVAKEYMEKQGLIKKK